MCNDRKIWFEHKVERPRQCTRMVAFQGVLHRWKRYKTLLRGPVINNNALIIAMMHCCESMQVWINVVREIP